MTTTINNNKGRHALLSSELQEKMFSLKNELNDCLEFLKYNNNNNNNKLIIIIFITIDSKIIYIFLLYQKLIIL